MAPTKVDEDLDGEAMSKSIVPPACVHHPELEWGTAAFNALQEEISKDLREVIDLNDLNCDQKYWLRRLSEKL